ncbi:MAG TPA: OsmC family protein [Gemmatimonadaceae bacterium]|nr:OsmC family protein [Gemmatimonadaceae bacterium]
MSDTHRYSLLVRWTGNLGTGTATYRGYSRDHEYAAEGKPTIPGSSDPVFRGDGARYNPEELLVGALASCHMLWFLHLCAEAGVVLETYEDSPVGTMVVEPDGGGRFTEVVLRPHGTFRGDVDPALIRQLHERSHALCFVANSMNFPVRVELQVAGD